MQWCWALICWRCWRHVVVLGWLVVIHCSLGREGRSEERGVGREWRKGEGVVVQLLRRHSCVHAGASSPFTHAGSLWQFVHAGVGPSSIRRPSCSFCVCWLLVAVWLVVFGCGCLRIAVVLICMSCHVVSSSSHVMGGAGPLSLLGTCAGHVHMK